MTHENTPPVKIAALLLAAGDSTRMGSPKALLDFHGRPLVEHVAALARKGGCSDALVVLGRDADAIRAGVDLTGCRVLINEAPTRGQLSSLRLGMSALDFSTDAFLVWPVDCPLVRPRTVQSLIAAYAQWRRNLIRILLPVHAGQRGHPMLVDIGFRQPFMQLPEGESARKVIDDNPTQVKEVGVDDPGVLVDIDTPEEYRAALEAWHPEEE